MPSEEQINAFVEYMTQAFPPPATILHDHAPGGLRESWYRVSVEESGGVKRWVFATHDFFDAYLASDIWKHLRAWDVAAMVRRAAPTEQVLVDLDGARLMPRP